MEFVMFARRAQGRPCRGDTEVGRQRIIESVRETIREGSCSDLSRKELALRIGVTPALITYYFPKKESLLEAVTTPVIASYSKRLRELVEADTDFETCLRSLIATLVDLYGKDGRILRAYASFCAAELAPDANEIEIMTRLLSDFFFSWRGDERARCFDAAVLQGAVRGMCEFAARVETESVKADNSSNVIRDIYSEWLEPLFRLFASRAVGIRADLTPVGSTAFS